MKASLFAFVLLVLSSTGGALAGDKSRSGRSRARNASPPHARKSHHARNNNRYFYLEEKFRGQDFLDEWDYFSLPDPTHGLVNYLNKDDSMRNGLSYVREDNTFVMAVDDKTALPVGGLRNSVRISSKKTYNGGLFIADISHMPHGCSVWPAWWSVGKDWPSTGEIDVLEGVHDQATNQYTLHTSQSPGCRASPNRHETPTTARLATEQCAVVNGDNTGCAFIDEDPRTYGRAFNAAGGGVFAHLWTANEIKIWHFARDEIPGDIHALNPDPSSWGVPAAAWTIASCDIDAHFAEHVLVFDTTLCGDWAGATYGDAGCPGTCAEAVANPENYKNAFWRINYVAVYQPV